MTFRSLMLASLIYLTPEPTVLAQNAKEVISLKVLIGARRNPDRHIAGLLIQLKPGWKTYWRAPGEAGIQPHFDWSGSKNLAAVKVLWPRPVVFYQYGMRSIGYDTNVVLPLEIEPLRAGEPITLSAAVNLGVCDDICIPVQTDFSEVLPAGKVPLDHRIKKALNQQPKTALVAKLREHSCYFSDTADGLVLRVKLNMPSAGAPEEAVIETSNPLIWVEPPKTRRKGPKLTLQAQLIHSTGGAFALPRDDLRITVLGTDYAVDIKGCSND